MGNNKYILIFPNIVVIVLLYTPTSVRYQLILCITLKLGVFIRPALRSHLVYPTGKYIWSPLRSKASIKPENSANCV